MTTKLFLIEFSPKLEDGSRKIINETVLASCEAPGTAQLFKKLLIDAGTYKHLLDKTGDNSSIYSLTVEKRKAMTESIKDIMRFNC